MIMIRKSTDRGHANHGWLDTNHSFSFADYHDPDFMGFRTLRVINEDRVIAGAGFPTHPHRDMEIISYVIEGAMEHKDSMGNGSVIKPGDVQRMTAGTGITHSEFNHSSSDPLHFLQIWILPAQLGLTPGYEQKSFGTDNETGELTLIASSNGQDGSITIHQDVNVYRGRMSRGQQLSHPLPGGRHSWLQMVQGDLELNAHALETSDGAAISGENTLALRAKQAAHFLLFDLA